jgi:NADPH-dependent 2,4-dienoyl-CoA reductase/sulfur reductase-like enzyme
MAERLVIVGGNAGGMGAVSQARKGKPELEVIVFEQGPWTSYSSCGIPYLVGGDVDDVSDLVARSPAQHRATGTDLRLRHEVTALDLDRQEVEVWDLDGQRSLRQGYDHLLLGLGGLPIRPPLPGIDLPLVQGVQTLDDADALVRRAGRVDVGQVVVVGGGYIGLEMAEAFVQRGATVTLVERGEQVMAATLDPDIAAVVEDALRRFGVDLRLGCDVTGFEEQRVLTEDASLPADLVVLGIGVGPNSQLAADAGLELGVKDAVRVDDRQATSVPSVWAAGDCCESTHRVSGEKVHIALGTVANKQARVAGLNIGGADAHFPGVLGTAISKICGTEVARTGLTTAQAQEAGLDVEAAVVEATTKARYFPGAEPMTVKLIAERPTGRLLGAQIVGGAGSAKRIDTCAVALWSGLNVGDVIDLDLAYAPPFSSVWDPVQVAARRLQAALAGGLG